MTLCLLIIHCCAHKRPMKTMFKSWETVHSPHVWQSKLENKRSLGQVASHPSNIRLPASFTRMLKAVGILLRERNMSTPRVLISFSLHPPSCSLSLSTLKGSLFSGRGINIHDLMRLRIKVDFEVSTLKVLMSYMNIPMASYWQGINSSSLLSAKAHFSTTLSLAFPTYWSLLFTLTLL